MSIGRAAANPTKGFFVRMLTRDISLDDCILDLVDNSIDGAWELSGDKPSLSLSNALSGFQIDIVIAEDRFVVQDNCGGITLDQATTYAFTFGRDEEEADVEETEAAAAAADEPEAGKGHEQFSVGVYGIGMKRAIFKIGRNISIRSTYRSEGVPASFEVPIHVPTWLTDNNTPWDFPIVAAEDLPAPGVRIEVTDLAQETAARFRAPTFTASLRQVLGRDYMLPLMHGLKISVNGSPVAGRAPVMREGDDFAPMRDTYQDGGVTVEVLAGMAFPPPDELSPDDSDKSEADAGWYVLCNGRVIVAADTSSVTGWGVDVPRWHNQYNGFFGMVLFTAVDTVLLPMTTTKRGVDVSSEVYLRARARMMIPARAWIDYTNARKYALEDSKAKEEASRGLGLAAVPVRPTVHLPRVVPKREKTANINYARPLRQVRQLAAGFGNVAMTYRDVGMESFAYAYKMLVDEDDE